MADEHMDLSVDAGEVMRGCTMTVRVGVRRKWRYRVAVVLVGLASLPLMLGCALVGMKVKTVIENEDGRRWED